MTDIASDDKYIQTEETRFRSAVSESLVQKIGGSVNYCLDQIIDLTAENARIDLSYKKSSSIFDTSASPRTLAVLDGTKLLEPTTSSGYVIGSIYFASHASPIELYYYLRAGTGGNMLPIASAGLGIPVYMQDNGAISIPAGPTRPVPIYIPVGMAIFSANTAQTLTYRLMVDFYEPNT